MSSSQPSLAELIEQVNMSVQNSTFDKEYRKYLKKCRKLGISSYVLNVLVSHAKKRGGATSQIQPDVNFFIRTESITNDKKETSESSKAIAIKVVKKTPGWILVILFFLIVFVVGFAYDSITQRKVVGKLRGENIKMSFLKEKMNKIASLSEGVSGDIVIDDWKSNNHDNNTVSQKSYKFNAGNGDVLSFGYVVSSEKCCDSLSILLKCPNDSIVRLVREAKGDVSSSCSYTITQAGAYNLVLVYSKDYSVTKSLDCAIVNNIRIRRNTDKVLKEIHTIAVEENCVVIVDTAQQKKEREMACATSTELNRGGRNALMKPEKGGKEISVSEETGSHRSPRNLKMNNGEHRKSNGNTQETQAERFRSAQRNRDWESMKDLADEGYAPAYLSLAQHYKYNPERHDLAKQYAEKAKKAGIKGADDVIDYLKDLDFD